jgi:hypothetical protein
VDFGAAAAARHALYYLDVLATLVLTVEAEVHPAVIAAVRPLVIGAEEVPGMGYTSLVHSGLLVLWAGSRGVPPPAGPSLYPTSSLSDFLPIL